MKLVQQQWHGDTTLRLGARGRSTVQYSTVQYSAVHDDTILRLGARGRSVRLHSIYIAPGAFFRMGNFLEWHILS